MTNLRIVALLALFVTVFSTVGFAQKANQIITVTNNTAENIGLVTFNGPQGPVGNVLVPGQGTFNGPISGAYQSITVNHVVVPNGAQIPVSLTDGTIVLVNNPGAFAPPIIDPNEQN